MASASKPVVSAAKPMPSAPEKAELAPKAASKAKVVDFIVKNPTASDQRVAAEVEGATVDQVQDVRSDMGARHTWPKPKED